MTERSLKTYHWHISNTPTLKPNQRMLLLMLLRSAGFVINEYTSDQFDPDYPLIHYYYYDRDEEVSEISEAGDDWLLNIGSEPYTYEYVKNRLVQMIKEQ